MKKSKLNYKVFVFDHQPVTIYRASSAQNACRQAFRILIKQETMKRQPRTVEGGFEGTVLEILE